MAVRPPLRRVRWRSSVCGPLSGRGLVGIDAHKRSHTAVALERQRGEQVARLGVPASREGWSRLVAWALALGDELVVALEDCRHVSGSLERFLIARSQQLVRVPPKLMAGSRRSARERGKLDAIDAAAVARAYLRQPSLPLASCDAEAGELKLLADHREACCKSARGCRTGCVGTCTSSSWESIFPPGRSIACAGRGVSVAVLPPPRRRPRS